MFNELKLRLVISNMFLVFGIVTISFIAVFIFMQELLERDSTLTMKSVMYKNSITLALPSNQLFNESLLTKMEERQTKQIDDFDEDTNCQFFSYNRSSNVIVYNDKRYEPKEDGDLSTVFEKMIASTEKMGIIKYRGITYRYLINKNVFPVGTYKIVMYNLSSEHYFLRCLLVGLFIFDIILSILSYLISIYIANISIKPVKEAVDKQKQFTEDASHELRTPLTVIKTNMEVLKSEATSTIKEQEKWISYIDDEVNRMTNLVNDLLSLARLDGNTHNEKKETINLTEELFTIIEAYSKYVKNKDITIKPALDKNVMFSCEPNKIRQLINIFLDNAIKYNKKNGEVIVRLEKGDTTFNLSFEDTGVGIKKEDQKKVFNRFFRADSSRSTDGTGLGLSIAQGIIKKHNGQIKINSTVDVGSKFIITFSYN